MGSFEFSVDVSVTEDGKNAPEYRLDTDLAGEITLAELLKFSRACLITIANETLREEQAQGFDKDPIVAVDGRVGKPVANVSPFGSIEFNSRVDITAMLQDTYDAIRERSPVDTGQYISSHYVFLNGIQVANDPSSFETWINKIANGNLKIEDKDIIRFVNIQPYARKLERLGVTAQRQNSRTVKSRDHRKRSGERILAPNGAYYLTMRSIKRKYKRNSSVKFEFVSGSQLGLTASFRSKSIFSKKRTYLYPSISILASEAGLL